LRAPIAACAVAVAVAVAVALAGCGSASLSTRQLRGDASRICSFAARTAVKIVPPSSPAAGAAFLRRGAAVLGPELSQLRTLHPPSAMERDYRTALGAFSEIVAAIREGARALASGGDPVIEIKTLQQRLADPEQRADAAWKALGIPACVTR
jgi:hypothetical protein